MAQRTAAGWREAELSAGPVRFREVGSGEPVVFVHGVLASSTLWDQVAARLAPSARCVLADWPLGAHTRPLRADADLSPPALAGLIVELCDHLGLGPVTLVGNDTGGALCQLVAASHPDRVRRLVLTDCDAFDNFPPMKVFRLLDLAARLPGGLWITGQTMRLRPLWRLPLAFGHLARHPLDPQIVRGWFEPARRERGVRHDLAKVIKGLSPTYTQEAAARLDRFAGPALLAWSPEDRVFPYAHAERLASILPQGRLEPIGDSYAFVPLDQPDRLAELIQEFIQQTP